MDKKFIDKEGLKQAVLVEWSKLDEVNEYLNSKGRGRFEALQVVYFYLNLHSSLKELLEDLEYQFVKEIPGKLPSYYKTLEEFEAIIGELADEEK